MKNLFKPDINQQIRDFTLLFLRLSIGALLLTHGYPKLLKILGDGDIQFASVFGMSPELSITLAMSAEFLCNILVMLGLFTRFATIPIIFTMCVIVFIVEGSLPITQKELPILYLISYIYILFNGAGKHSIDNFIHIKLNKKR